MNLNFIKLDINILSNKKIKLIRKYPDGDKLIVLWLGILCLGMKSDQPGYLYLTNDIPYTNKDLSILFDIEEKTVQLGIELFQRFNMIEVMNGGIIEIINFNEHQKLERIEKVKQQSRISSKRYRERKKLEIEESIMSDSHDNESDGHFNDSDGHRDVTVTESDQTDKDIDIDKDIDNAEQEKKEEKSLQVKTCINKELHNKIKDFFLKYNESGYKDFKRQGRSINNIIKRAKLFYPDNTETETMWKFCSKFAELYKTGHKFWSKQPFLPSTLDSNRIWEMLDIEIKKPKEIEQETFSIVQQVMQEAAEKQRLIDMPDDLCNNSDGG